MKKNALLIKGKIFKLNENTKIFGLLIISTIIVNLAGTALDWRFGQDFFHLSDKSVFFSDLLSPGTEGGYFEYYQYILLLWCGILSTVFIFSRKLWGAFSIPLTYFLIFLDDSLLHDRLVNIIFNILDRNKISFLDQFSRLKDSSELVYWFLFFLLVLILSLPEALKNNSKVRDFIFNNYKLFFLMAFFAIFIDTFVYGAIFSLPITNENIAFLANVFMLLLEEIGEIVIIAGACIWLFNLNFRNHSNKLNQKNNLD
tara:strand:+ start:288 stop:1058 length:771 start_codon:yes stop_codon:yes gene_type:complete